MTVTGRLHARGRDLDREPSRDVAARLAAEATRRGLSVEDVAAELIARLAPRTAQRPTTDDALEAFIGCGASGRPEPFDVHAARFEQAGRRRLSDA
jgi:hypothetical protein